MNRPPFFSLLSTAFARLLGTLDAGPGNTAGEPLSVAGHLVFAPATRTPVEL